MSKLWIYTNYDCNLTCAYCSVESSPTAPRRALSLSTVQQLIDEALALNFSEVFFTGGEPFILDEIYAMLAYAATRVKTTVLTNAMLLKGSRLDRLRAIQHDNLIVQVSLDGARPDLDRTAFALRRRLVVVVGAAIALVGALVLVPRLGTEFVPVMDEGAFDMDVQLIPGISLEQGEHHVHPRVAAVLHRHRAQIGAGLVAPAVQPQALQHRCRGKAAYGVLSGPIKKVAATDPAVDISIEELENFRRKITGSFPFHRSAPLKQRCLQQF